MSEKWDIFISHKVLSQMKNMTGAGLKVIFALMKYADKSGRCWPSISTLAGDCGLSRRGVQAAIKDLQKKGFLTIRQGGSGQKNTHNYELTFSNIKGAESAPINPIKGAESAPLRVQKVHPNYTQGTKPNIKQTKKASQKKAISIHEAEKLVEYFHETVKSKLLDRSGSMKIWKTTAKRVLQGHTFEELETAVSNYAKASADVEAKYRKGFQSFFGKQAETYKDFLVLDAEFSLSQPDDYSLTETQIAEIIALEDKIALEAKGACDD